MRKCSLPSRKTASTLASSRFAVCRPLCLDSRLLTPAKCPARVQHWQHLCLEPPCGRVHGSDPGDSERRCSLIRLLPGAGGKEGADVSSPWPGAGPAWRRMRERPGLQLSSLSGPRWGRFGRGSPGREPWLPITVTCISLLVSVSGITGWVGHIGHPAGLGSTG